MMSTRPPLAALVAAVAAASLLAGCAGGGSEPQADAGPVTLTVGDYPASSNPASQATFDKRVEAFTAANPDIVIEPVETMWDAQTFQASVAGGTLPDVIKVPFTEIQALIARGQVADVTDALAATDLTANLNPQTAGIAQDAEGRQFGVPVNPYAIGLFYNRELFTEAGLDPDDPPRTWDEVRSAAETISEETGQAGYAQMTTENTGGWMLTAQTYSMGGSIESDDGSQVTFDAEPTKQALRQLQAMRWEDESMGATVLYNMNDIAKDFAAGKIGMFMSVPSASYGAAVTSFGMDREDVGLAPVPTGPGFDGQVLAGGSVSIVNPDADEATKAAAVRWIGYSELQQYSDEETARTTAAATAADGGNVGIPRISPVDPALYEQYLGWIEESINVPQENVASYTENLAEVTLKTEPPTSAQEVYALLDTVVQQVLTEPGADVDALVAEAAQAAQTKIERSAR